MIVPVVVVGTESPDQGPFGIFAASLRIEELPNSRRRPRRAASGIEAIVLTGRAIAHGAAENEAPGAG